MYDYLELGTAPTNEDCVQVSRDVDYHDAMREQACRYRDMLQALFPAPEGAQLIVKRLSHDFGSYWEVCAKFDTASEDAIEWAFNVEANLPEYWN